MPRKGLEEKPYGEAWLSRQPINRPWFGINDSTASYLASQLPDGYFDVATILLFVPGCQICYQIWQLVRPTAKITMDTPVNHSQDEDCSEIDPVFLSFCVVWICYGFSLGRNRVKPLSSSYGLPRVNIPLSSDGISEHPYSTNSSNRPLIFFHLSQ